MSSAEGHSTAFEIDTERDEKTQNIEQHESRSNVEGTKESFIAKIFVNHTAKTCIAGIIVPILCVLVIIASGSFSLSDSSNREFFVLSDITAKQSDGRTAARDDYPFTSSGQASLQQRDTDNQKSLNILLRGKIKGTDDTLATLDDFENAENVLTKESFILQKRAEDRYYKSSNYTNFCKVETGAVDCNGEPRKCALPNSYLNHPNLFGEYLNNNSLLCGRKDGTELSDEDFQLFLDDLFGNDIYKSKVYFDLNLTSANRIAWAAKSIVLVGVPFPGFASASDDTAKQDDLFVDWAEPLTNPINDDDELSNDKLDVYVLSSVLLNSQFNSLIINDLALAVIAIALVFLVIWIHTSSLVLSCSAMVQVLLAFPFAYFVYYFIFRQLYFSTLQILTIFLILGIGADDVFVFTDAWKQAAVVLGKDVDLIKRMSWTYRRAVRAMTVTSFTTAAAFFVTATSPIMPISTLGVWAGTLVLFQFVLVIIVYPCAVVTWHRFWRPRFFVKGFKKVEDEKQLEEELATPCFYRCLPSGIRPKVKVRGDNEYRAVEKFFRGPWFRVITFSKYVLIVVAIVLAGFSIYRATDLQTPLETESFLPADHPFMVASDTLSDGFPRGDVDLQLKVYITWGIEGVDRTGLSRYDIDETGETIFDNSFDLKQKSVQQRILDACTFFGNNKELIFQQETGFNPVECWIADYRDWRKTQLNKDDFETFSNDEDLVKELLAFGNFSNRQNAKPYLRYLSNQRIGFNQDQTKVLFTEVRFIGDIELSAPESQMSPIYDLWQEELDKFNEQSGNIQGGNKAIATADFAWMWMTTQQTLLRSMLQGLGIMIIVAFFTLLFSTHNVIVAILATCCIGGVITMLLGFISIVGWYLGVTESVSVIIGIGYSFDGVAHVATAYVECKEFNRQDKVKHALTELGISVLFGSVTTLLAGLALSPAVITFFTKFAALLIATVILSLLWSLVFFPAFLLVIGPNGEFASLRKLFSCFRRQKNEDESQDSTQAAQKEIP